MGEGSQRICDSSITKLTFQKQDIYFQSRTLNFCPKSKTVPLKSAQMDTLFKNEIIRSNIPTIIQHPSLKLNVQKKFHPNRQLYRQTHCHSINTFSITNQHNKSLCEMLLSSSLFRRLAKIKQISKYYRT